VKRLLANLALVAVISTFVLPLGVAFETRGTPVCCLPGGKHHCTQKSTGPELKGKTDACPYVSQLLATGFTGLYLPKFELGGPAVVGLLAVIVAYSYYRNAGLRASDRGPPALSF
jgi:hypothetical protein